jgi:hypothetical protein
MVAEAPMSLFHPAEVRRSRLAIDAGGRLSLVRAVLVIAALSLLCWAVLIALIVGLRAML